MIKIARALRIFLLAILQKFHALYPSRSYDSVSTQHHGQTREHMPDHLYRFRSIHSILGGFHELENQEIYFCPPQQLNDPLEGFKDIFWKGDEIVWRNLLRLPLMPHAGDITIYHRKGNAST
jgi:hypothetical protein